MKMTKMTMTKMTTCGIPWLCVSFLSFCSLIRFYFVTLQKIRKDMMETKLFLRRLKVAVRR